MSPHPTAPLLETRSLAVSIGGNAVCRELDLALRPGERLAILGRNGAGKSTLLSVLAGLRAPQSGQVLLAGTPYAVLAPRAAARIRGWLPQARGDAFASTVLETALTGRHPHLDRWDWESPEDARLAREALRAVGLAGFETRNVLTLSGGERQRLAIATLLTQAPRLLLLDEPLAHLDLNHQIAMLELFAGAARDCGAAVAMVLHEPGLACRFCDRALLMHGDGNTELGPVDAVVNADALARLYAHPLRELRDGEHRWFIPA